MAKKIFCILIVCSFFAAFGLQVAGAEIVTLASNEFRFWDIYNSGEVNHYYQSSTLPGPNSSNPSGSYVISVRPLENGYGTHYFCMSSNYYDPEAESYALHPLTEGYTYSGSFVFDFTAISSSAASRLDFSKIVSSLFVADGLNLSNQQVNAFDFTSFDDVALGVSVVPDETVNYRYQVSFNFAFNMISVEDIGFQPSVISIYADLTQGVLTSGSEANFRWYGTTISCVYDPSGEIFESEADKIIEGQKAAAQYALEQEQQANQDAYNSALNGADTSIFDLSSLATSFQTLYNGLNYQGTDFHFMFPGSGVVPYVGLELWTQQEIPFKTWIDAIPPSIMAVVRFAAWFALAWAFISRIRALIQDINGGDD